MRSVIFTILLAFVATLVPQTTTAQYYDQKWAISTGVDFLDYQAPMDGQFFQINNFDPALTVGVSRYLSGAFALSTNLTFGQGVRFPGFDWTEERPNLLDMNYLLHFKLNNGALMRERARIAPYFLLGFGGSYVKNHPDLYVPLGGGVQVRLSQKVNLRTQMMVKRSINKDYQNLSHAIAFVYNIGKDQTPHQAPDTLGEELLVTMTPTDQDKDGIIDKRDACPEMAGVASFEGCPDRRSLALTRLEKMPLDPAEEPSYASALAEPITAAQQKSFGIAVPEEPQAKPQAQSQQVVAQQPSYIPQASANKSKASFLDQVENTPSSGIAFEKQNIAETKTNFSSETSEEHKTLFSNNLEVNSIYFNLNSDKLNEESKAILDEVAYMLHNNSEAKLVVRGHADASGSDRHNKVLSIMRAYHVKYYLVYEKGVSPSRVISTGFGEKSPIANNTTENGRSLNRRVDFELVM